MDEQPATPASYADFEDEKSPGLLRTVVQFFAIPLLIVCVAVGIYIGINLMVGAGPQTAADFVELLQSDTINRRWQAAYELANRLGDGEVPDEFREPRLVLALNATLKRSREEKEDPPRLAILVLRILRRLQDPAALPAVREALDDESDWIRSHAILVAAGLGDHESKGRIAELARDADQGTRRAALEGLAMMDQIDGRPFRLSSATRALAREHLADAHEDVRFTAALILADAGDREAALPVLRTMLDRAYLESFEFEDRLGGLSRYTVHSNLILTALDRVERLDCRDDPEVLAALARLADDRHEGEPEVRKRADKLRHAWGLRD